MSTRSAGITLAPPLIYLLFIGFAWLLGMQLPLDLPDNAWTRGAGWSLVAAGPLLMVWAVWAMLRQRTTVNPYGQPARLVAAGPFRFSRNPIYLGDTLVYGGIALLQGSLWFWLLLPALIQCMRHGVILREEQLLGQLFGDDYRAYCQRVRRWL